MMKRLLGVIALGLILVGAYFFVNSPESDEQATNGGVASADQKPGETVTLGYDDVKKMTRRLGPKQRKAVLSDPRRFAQMINAEATRQSLLRAARNTKLDENKAIQDRIQRQSEDILRTAYVNQRLAAAGIPKGFPSDKQVRAYYKQNKSKYKLTRRVPVWQIFWRIPKNASEQEAAKVIKQASVVATSLKAGKQKFHVAAQKYSQHRVSSLRGGFMGVLKVSELHPKIKDKLLALKEGVVSSPIRQDDGVHVFLRGEIVPETQLTLKQVRPAIIKHLKEKYRDQQRVKLKQLAKKKFPTVYTAKEAEKWRTNLAQERVKSVQQTQQK